MDANAEELVQRRDSERRRAARLCGVELELLTERALRHIAESKELIAKAAAVLAATKLL